MSCKVSCVEITTANSCPVRCNICPCDVYTCALNKIAPGVTALSYDDYCKALANIPIDVAVNFTGFTEPFINQRAVDMVEEAYRQGHEIIVSSTLVGLKPEDARRLVQIPFKSFCWHLPDNLNTAKIPDTDAIRETTSIILRSVENILYSRMNTKFYNHTRGGLVGNPVIHRNVNRWRCSVHKLSPSDIDFIMLPDCSVTFCCMDFGLKCIIGNLKRDSYGQLVGVMERTRKALKETLCSHCVLLYPPRKYYVLESYLGAKSIIKKAMNFTPAMYAKNEGED